MKTTDRRARAGHGASDHGRSSESSPAETLVAFGLGSNLGNSESTLWAAAAWLEHSFPPTRLASPYRTAPLSPIPQGDYLNTVILGHLPRSPPFLGPTPDIARRLVAAAKALEKAAGRPLGRGQGPRDGPRVLDVDVLLLGQHRLDLPELLGTENQDPKMRLCDGKKEPARSDSAPDPFSDIGFDDLWQGEIQIPHPRLAERRFVLAPLAEIIPELRLPGEDATVEELLARLGSAQRATRSSWASSL